MAQFIAIDTDAHGLFVVAATLRGPTIVLDRVGHFENSPPLTTASAAELGAKLREWLKSIEIRPAPVLLAIGRDKVILKEVRHPPAPPAEEPAVVRFQALKDLTESPDDVAMDYTPLPPTSEGERRAAVVFVRNDVLTAARAVCDAAGLRLAAVTPRPFTAAALLRHAVAGGSVPTPKGSWALVSLWPDGGEFTVVRGTDVLFSRAVPSGIDERLVIAELRRNFAIHDSQHPADPISAIYVAEAYGHREGWTDRLGDVLSLPIHRLDPLAGAAVAEAIPPASHGRFAAPVGLLAAQAGEGLPINFTSRRQPRSAPQPARRKVLVGAAVVGIALLCVAVLGGLQLIQAERRLTAANLAATDLDERLQQLEVDGKRLAAADEFASREVVWLDELYDLADRIPDVRKMRLTEVDGTATQPAKTVGTGKAAALPSKGAKPTPIATLRVAVSTDESALVDKLLDAVNRDGFYVTASKTTAAAATASSRMQQFLVSAQVLHRTPGDYRRRLTVSAPLAPPPPPPPASVTAPKPAPVEFDFGGFNP